MLYQPQSSTMASPGMQTEERADVIYLESEMLLDFFLPQHPNMSGQGGGLRTGLSAEPSLVGDHAGSAGSKFIQYLHLQPH